MSYKKSVNAIKNANIPLYLRGDEREGNAHLCFDQNICCESQKFSMIEINPISAKESILENSPSANKFSSAIFLKTPENLALRRFNQKALQEKQKKLVKTYFLKPQVIKQPRVRSHSLERVAPHELSMFTVYNYTLKDIKKKCNLNLWCLLEISKEFYKIIKNDTIHGQLQEMGALVFNFIFSSIRKLRFDQCKEILEKLGKIEALALERLNAAKLPKTPVLSTPSIVRQPKPTVTVPPNATDMKSFLDTIKMGKITGKKEPIQSSKAKLPSFLFSSNPNRIRERLTSEPLAEVKPLLTDDRTIYKYFSYCEYH